MSDEKRIKIVIDMPKSEYESIIKWVEDNDIVLCVYSYIALGKVLPEEHGRLIDADALIEYTHNQIDGVICCDDIAFAPTIIEADKGDKE